MLSTTAFNTALCVATGIGLFSLNKLAGPGNDFSCSNYHLRRQNKASVANESEFNPIVVSYLDKTYVLPKGWIFESSSKGGRVFEDKCKPADYTFWHWQIQAPVWEDSQDDLAVGSMKTHLTIEEQQEFFKMTGYHCHQPDRVALVKWEFKECSLPFHKRLEVYGDTFSLFN